MKRRDLLRSAVLGGAALVFAPARGVVAAADGNGAVDPSAIERRHGGRLGLAVLDTGSGRRLVWRGGERFLMCSTFKWLAVAAVLARVDAGRERLDRHITFGRKAVLEWAPVTREHVGPPGMTVEALCEAAMVISDNTAANLLLETLGGPAGMTAWVRATGDAVTRLDRHEPELNRPEGDKDTTTPRAMQESLRRILLGDVLSPASRGRLLEWLRHNRTGADSLRGGLPSGWRVGDKTGSGRTANNDVAILWPPHGKPVLVAAYYDNAKLDADARKLALAAAGRLVAAWHAGGRR